VKAATVATFLLCGVASAAAAKLPNIVIIYADDLGFGDLSCYHPEAAYKTPRFDQMAAEGIRFTDAHSPSTICSPSRYGLFSGQQIYRSTGRGGEAFEGPGEPRYLKPGTLTLGEILHEKGYSTGILAKYALTETLPDAPGQLYNLAADPGEATNLYSKEPSKRQELQALLKELKESGRSAPKGSKPIGMENIPKLK
jgi:arylsulfatase A-like enzyme